MDRRQVNFALYTDKAHATLMAHRTASKFAQVMVPIVDSLTGIAMAVVVVVGGSMVLDQRLEAGVMVAFLFYIQRFFDPIRSLTMQYSVMQRAMASGQRLIDVLDVPVEIADAPGVVDLPHDTQGAGRVPRRDLRYNPAHPVLKNVSFTINPGETVALVGPHRLGQVQRGVPTQPLL